MDEKQKDNTSSFHDISDKAPFLRKVNSFEQVQQGCRVYKNQGRPIHFLAYILSSATITTFDEQLMSQGIAKIAEICGVPMSQAQWLSTINFIGTAISAVPLANVGQIIGQIKFLIITYLLLTVVYLSCALYGNFYFLMVMRLLSGCLNSGAFANRNIIFVQYPQKSSVQNVLRMSLFIPSLLNIAVPFLTGFLISINFQYQFYILSGLCFVSSLTIMAFGNMKPNFLQKYKFDYLGVLFLALCVGLFCLSTVEFSDKNWTIASILMVVSLIAGTIFIFVELRVQDPILPPQLLRRPVSEMLLFNMFGFMKFIATQYLLPQYLPYLGIKNTQIGFILMISTSIGFLSTVVINWVQKYVVIHILMKICSFFSIVFIIFQSLFQRQYITLLLFYWFGYFFDVSNIQQLYTLFMQAIPREYAVYIGGLPTISRTVGQSLATCLANCLFSALKQEFPNDIPLAYEYSMLTFLVIIVLQFVTALFIGSGRHEVGKYGYKELKHIVEEVQDDKTDEIDVQQFDTEFVSFIPKNDNNEKELHSSQE